MVQGGRSKDGDDSSLWGPAFVDEFDDRLKHDGIGVLSSANAGPNTNKRQFFVSNSVANLRSAAGPGTHILHHIFCFVFPHRLLSSRLHI